MSRKLCGLKYGTLRAPDDATADQIAAQAQRAKVAVLAQRAAIQAGVGVSRPTPTLDSSHLGLPAGCTIQTQAWSILERATMSLASVDGP